jgi:hypothetical protein
MMIVEMLEELGHRVIAEAGNIRTAEPLAQTAAFDLGVLDINVAGFNISPVAEIVAARGLPFIFVSGYGPDGRPVMFTDKPVLRKPFLVCHRWRNHGALRLRLVCRSARACVKQTSQEQLWVRRNYRGPRMVAGFRADPC